MQKDKSMVIVSNLLLIQRFFGVGTKKTTEVFELLKSRNLLGGDIRKIPSDAGLDKKALDLFRSADYTYCEEIIRDAEKKGVRIISYFDRDFPAVLKNIPTEPFLLFVKGELPDFEKTPSVAVVGPRKPSSFGKKAAFSLGFRLARAGMTVVSGGAYGSDTAAHKGALKAGGKTVLVLGCGIEAEYLMGNIKLRNAVAKSGCLISEYPIYVKPTRYSFPVRNRIISALSLATVVVEAPEKSGALITASHAIEQGRDVFVIPGNPVSEEYKGSNKLLRDGAKPLIDAMDVLGEYIGAFPDKIDPDRAFSPVNFENSGKKIQKIQKKSCETLSNEAKIVYNYLDKQIFTDTDLQGIDLNGSQVLSALTELELEGFIEAMPGGNYKMK